MRRAADQLGSSAGQAAPTEAAAPAASAAPARPAYPAIAAGSGVASLLLVAVVVRMVWKP